MSSVPVFPTLNKLANSEAEYLKYLNDAYFFFEKIINGTYDITCLTTFDLDSFFVSTTSILNKSKIHLYAKFITYIMQIIEIIKPNPKKFINFSDCFTKTNPYQKEDAKRKLSLYLYPEIFWWITEYYCVDLNDKDTRLKYINKTLSDMNKDLLHTDCQCKDCTKYDSVSCNDKKCSTIKVLNVDDFTPADKILRRIFEYCANNHNSYETIILHLLSSEFVKNNFNFIANLLINLYSNKIIPNSDHYDAILNNNALTIEKFNSLLMLLIEFGYKLTYDDILKSCTKYNRYICNLNVIMSNDVIAKSKTFIAFKKQYKDLVDTQIDKKYFVNMYYFLYNRPTSNDELELEKLCLKRKLPIAIIDNNILLTPKAVHNFLSSYKRNSSEVLFFVKHIVLMEYMENTSNNDTYNKNLQTLNYHMSTGLKKNKRK